MKKILNFIFFIGMTIPAYGKLSATSFPSTIQDMSFKSHIEIATEGYKPFLDKKAYQELNIVPGEEFYTDRIITEMEAENRQQETDRQTMALNEYCIKYPDDYTKCPRPAAPSEASQQTQPTQQQTYFSGRTIGGGPVVENNYITGGSCYPAAKDKILSNKIHTTGKYEKIHPAFEKGLITIFRKEGGCGRINNDHCGYTCYGISECAGVHVNSRAEAEEVYYKQYWKPKKFERLPDVIASDMFVAAVWSGNGTAMQHLRDFLGLPIKSTPVDNEVIKAINNYQGDIYNDWINYREAFLMDVARRRYNGSVSNGFRNAIELKRKNGCHVRPSEPLYR